MKKFIKKLSPKKYLLYSLIIAGGIAIDQLTKLLTVLFLKPVGSVALIPGVLNLTYVENRGAAFGMLADSRWVFMVISTITILGMLTYLYIGMASSNILYEISIAMLISGGIGNMIDRSILGYVVDMIDFCLINFAVFNGADSFVCVGAGILILALILDLIKESKAKKALSENAGEKNESEEEKNDADGK